MRALKALVIIMAIMIVAGVTIIVVTIAKRGREMAETGAPGVEEPARPRGFDAARIEIPEGGRIVEMTAEGERLVLRLRLADSSERLVFVDMGSGRVIGTLTIGEAP